MSGVRLKHQQITEVLAKEIRAGDRPTGSSCRANTPWPSASASAAPRCAPHSPS